MCSLNYWHDTYGVTRYNTIHWHKIFIVWLFQIILIIHSTIIYYKIVWCKWLNNLRHFTAQNTSNYTIIWHKSFCLLKSTAWVPLMKSISIPFISEANSSPPSSMNHWLLFVKPMKRGEQAAGNGRRKGEESSTKWGWARLLFLSSIMLFYAFLFVLFIDYHYLCRQLWGSWG